jgi:hypothetical protein
MTIVRLLLLGLLGPVLALIVTWHLPFRVANISAGVAPARDKVARLRTVPNDSALAELREIAVSYPGFQNMETDEVLESATRMLHGEYVAAGLDISIGVPFEAGEYLFGHSTRHLELHSFLVPSLLGRAYEVSGNPEYIQAAVQYILDWAEFESGLLIPRGYFFNDHALAARSIVVTETWRLYRNSSAYRTDVATGLLGYVQKLSRLLLEDKLYEYRTNHGIMQSLSLLHLGIAFPLLEVSKENVRVAKERLTSQLNYYVNNEGVILEHSPGYHRNGIRRLAAAARYFSLTDEPVSDDFVGRYHKAVDFLTDLRRPDGTLPPIGDTDDRPLSTIQAVAFDHHAALEQVTDDPAEMRAPSAVTTAPGAGWVVLWDGQSDWPDASKLTQTVLHWGNFPTGVHKHADDMGISLWSHGQQWVRSIGHWPYIASRNKAIGWRSSNAPHWLNESYANVRDTRLAGSVVDSNLAFFDVLRSNTDGSRIRRQVLKLGSDTWIVLDSFESGSPRKAEVIWRFPPTVMLRKTDEPDTVLGSAGPHGELRFHVDGSGPVNLETDPAGTAAWNTGIVASGKITPSPAIRLTSSATDAAMATFLELRGAASEPTVVSDKTDMKWESAASWRVSVDDDAISAEREADVIKVSRGQEMHAEVEISRSLAKSATASRDAALAALDRASRKYGTPFQSMTERRLKVTFAVVGMAMGQLLVLALAALRHKKWILRLATCSTALWIGFSLYLELIYLV